MTQSISLTARLEALLFVASEPLSSQQLATATGEPAEAVTEALTHLRTELANRGVRLSSLNGRHKLVTAPEAASLVRKFLQDEAKTELSRPALETLAIIAYRGPLTKTAIEGIRGVASDTMIRNLLARGLIAEAGKSTEPGRPLRYAVSHAFLQHFGLTSPADLPPVPDASPKPGAAPTSEATRED